MGKNQSKYEEKMKYLFFWKGNDNPFSNDKDDKPFWVPYDLIDSLFLEENYQLYLKGDMKLVEIGDYYYDFKNWFQINKIDNNKQRQIKRDIAENVYNIMRKNRFEESIMIKTSICEINNDNYMDCLMIGYENCFFKVIPKNIKNIKIKRELNFFGKQIDINYKNFTQLLYEEIENNSIILKKENVYRDLMNSMKENNFFKIILKMYTIESFLYRNLNEIIRTKSTNSYELIKYFYVSLLASFEYCSEKFRSNTKKILGKNNYKLYRGSKISNDEIKLYEVNGKLRMINEFLSTTYDQKIALKFCKPSDHLDACLYEIELQKDDEVLNNLALVKKISQFKNEKEILIRSGSVLKINSLELNPNTRIHHMKVSLFSKSYEAVYDYILNSKTLSILELQDNELGRKSHLILNVIIKVQRIKILNLAGNLIGVEGAKLISYGIKENNSLTEIYLSKNNLSCTGVYYISLALEQNKSLTIIDLSSNSIYNKGYFNISSALKINQIIIKLYLKDNHLCNKGALVLSEALKINKSLQILDISNNNLGGMGGIYISEGLELNTSLTLLNINDNKLGHKGSFFILEALMKNKILRELHLSSNEIAKEGVEFIAETLEQNKSFNLHLRSNEIGEKEKLYLSNLNLLNNRIIFD